MESLTAKKAWKRAYREINDFEKQLTDDGFILIKLFFTIDKNEQTRRFRARYEDPNKRWKLTEADVVSLDYWQSYQDAYRDMLDKTSKKNTPWQVIAANNKRHARISAMTCVRDALAEVVNLHEIEIMSPELEQRIKDALYD